MVEVCTGKYYARERASSEHHCSDEETALASICIRKSGEAPSKNQPTLLWLTATCVCERAFP